MFQRSVKEVNAEYPAEDRFLDSIQRTVRDTCVAAGMSRKEASAVLLAVEEGATNIIRHAYLYSKGTIRVRLVVYSNQIVISLFDTGRSFQPDMSSPINLDRLVESGRKGGLGFYMMRKIMDSVEYISTADFNELRMIKRLQKPKDAALPLFSRFSTLRAKFSLFTFLVVLVIVGGSYYYIDRRTRSLLGERLEQTVVALANTVADQAAGYMLNSRSDVEFDELIVSYLRANPELRSVIITDSLSLIVAHSQDIRNIRKPLLVPSEINRTVRNQAQAFDTAKQVLNYLIVPVSAGLKQLGEVHIVYSTELITEEIAEQRSRVVYLTMLWLGIGIVSIYLLSNYFVGPIARITGRIRRFASGDMETELPLEGAEEFFEISKAFNEMMTRVNQDRKTIAAREKMAKEVEVASHIQKTLLPSKLPKITGLDIDTYYRAASMVGGDLYDIFQIGPSRYCMTVADVSGKGVPASLVMSMLRTVIQIQAEGGESARDILVKVNSYIERNILPGMFVTVLMIVYDSELSHLSCVSAGHTPLLYYRAATQSLTQINPAGMPIGMPVTLGQGFAGKLEEFSTILEEGDMFFAFTDGVTEAGNRAGELYGLDRLEAFFNRYLSEQKEVSAKMLSIELLKDMDAFTGSANPADDLTYIIAHRTEHRIEESASPEPFDLPVIQIPESKSDAE